MDTAATYPKVRVRSVVLDCADPDALSSFYAALLGGRRHHDDPDWCEVVLEDPAMKLAFQRVDDYRAPEWPEGSPQQLHLDFTVTELVATSARAVSLGATALGEPVEEEGGRFMVHTDPAGHPFCLVVENGREPA
jgi:predicted enzyme related to lactoylglutathione lyase